MDDWFALGVQFHPEEDHGTKLDIGVFEQFMLGSRSGRYARATRTSPSGVDIRVPVIPGIIDTEMLRSCFGADAANYPDPAAWAEKAVPFTVYRHSLQNHRLQPVPAAAAEPLPPDSRMLPRHRQVTGSPGLVGLQKERNDDRLRGDAENLISDGLPLL